MPHADADDALLRERRLPGSTAEAYRRFRRDVPAPVLDQLLTHLRLTPADRAIDLGAGTGQVAMPLAARLAGVLALDPEPDMLVQLRRRAEDEQLTNLVGALAADADLPALACATGVAGFGLMTVANALHWMAAAAVFTATRRLLRPGGGVAVMPHGRPLWLGERNCARALRNYLEDWFGPVRAGCGTDEQTLLERRRLLEHHFSVPVDADFVIGHLYSTLPPGRLPDDHRDQFAAGVRAVLGPHATLRGEELVKDVPVAVRVGRRSAG